MYGWKLATYALLVAAILLSTPLPSGTQGAGRSVYPPPTPIPDLKGVTYLAIGPSEFAYVLQPLLEWKEVRGQRCGFVSLETIESEPNFSGRDIQETIRNFLVWAANASIDPGKSDGVRWVLLAGDGEIIPPRSVFVNHRSENGSEDPKNYVPTDFYYAGLDGNWDLDMDGVYGEDMFYPGDEEEADLEWNVFVGRFPASNVTELKVMVERQLSYEKEPPAGPWARSMLFAGSLMAVPNKVNKPETPSDEGYDEYKDNAYKVVTNITASLPDHVISFTLLDYPKAPPGGYNRLFDTLNASSFLKFYEMGYSNVFLACHGDENGNCTDYKGDSGGTADYFADYEAYFDYDQAKSVVTDGKIPLMYISNCGSLNFAEEDDTNLETVMLNPNGGAIGVIGATTETFRGEIAPEKNFTGSYGNWWLAEEFYRILYGETPHPGEALYKQKWNYQAHIWNEMQPFDSEWFRAFRIDTLAYNLLGDPEGPIWLDEPRLMNVTGVNPHVVTDQTIEPIVKDVITGEGVQGAVVHMEDLGDPGIRQTMRTDGSGLAIFYSSMDDLSDFRLTVTHPGYLPAILEVDVVSLYNLGIRNLRISPLIPTSGSEATFRVEVFNNGSLGAINFAVNMTVTGGSDTDWELAPVEELGPGDYTTVSARIRAFPGENVFRASFLFFDQIQIDVTDDVLVAYFTANEEIVILPGLPDPLLMDEDIPLSDGGTGAIPLRSFFVDPDGELNEADLSVNSIEGKLTPSIIIDGSNRPFLEIVPAPNWFGNGSIRIEATDGFSTVRKVINVTVSSIPDKPTPSIYPESVVSFEDWPSNFTVAFLDPDSTDLTVQSPLDWVSIGFGAASGAFNISILPGEDQVGNSFINLTVTDGTGLSSNLLIPLRVEPTNDPPKINGIKSIKAMAGRTFDIDLMIEDDSPGPFNITAIWEFGTTFSNSSLIKFKAPSDAHRGIFHITVNVTDSEGVSTIAVLEIDMDRKDSAILPITIIVIVVVILVSILIGYSVYSRLEEKRLSETLSSVTAPAQLPELTMDDFRAGGGDYLAMPPSHLESELGIPRKGDLGPEEDEILHPAEDLDGDIDDVIGEFYKD